MITKTRRVIISDLAKTYRQTGLLFHKCISGALHDNPIYNQASMPLLKALLQHGAMSQHAIAKELNHTDASISRQIKLLLEKSFVSSKADPTNRRIAIIRLTPKGRQALKKIEVAVLGYLADILAPLSDQKLKQIIKANTELQSIITNQFNKENHE
jgi:DNA-binding MarR family transcriptional regulator